MAEKNGIDIRTGLLQKTAFLGMTRNLREVLMIREKNNAEHRQESRLS